MSSQLARFAKLATIGLCSGALLVGGANSVSAESDNENLLLEARAAGVGEVVTGKAVTERAAPDVGAPLSAQDLENKAGFLVYDFYPDEGDGTSVPPIDEAAIMVTVQYSREAYAAAFTKGPTKGSMTANGGMAGIELDLNRDSETDLLSLTPPRFMKVGVWWESTFGEWNGSRWVDSRIPVYWTREKDAYVAGFDWQDLPRTKVSWRMRIVDELGGEDLAPNDFGTRVQLDKVAPRTKITSGTRGTVDSRKAKFYFNSNEAKSTFECKLDSRSWRACVSPKSYKGLENGDHKFKVRATDKAGNTDATPAFRKFTTAKRIKVSLTTKDNGSKLVVDVDPNKANANYEIKVQKRKDGAWKTVRATWTRGPTDRRTINLGRGQYRIKVPAQYNLLGATSNSVRLKR